MNITTPTTITPGSKFVCSWGYDQTQVSAYNTVSIKGQYVTVEGLNSWSNFDESDLTIGSTVKVYCFTEWDSLTVAEQADLSSRGFNWDSYRHHYGKAAREAAPIRTIVKTARINGQSWSYLWALDNGDIVDSTENYRTRPHIEIVHGLKRCLLQTGYDGSPTIRIDQVISAHYDPDYDTHKAGYAAQNEYTNYNGR